MAGARAALPRNDTGRSRGRSGRTDTPRPSVGSTSSRTWPIGGTMGTSIEWHGKTRSGPVGGRANPETTRTDRASWGPTIVSEPSSARSRGGGNACGHTSLGTRGASERQNLIRVGVPSDRPVVEVAHAGTAPGGKEDGVTRYENLSLALCARRARRRRAAREHRARACGASRVSARAISRAAGTRLVR